MRRYFWWLLNAALFAVVIGQVWSYQTCPSMTSPSDCRRYSAGCDLLCTAGVPMSDPYTCCCSVRSPITGNVIGCCEAICRQWACYYIVTGTWCDWDIDFGELNLSGVPQVRYVQNVPCVHNPTGRPMQGNCASGGPPGGPGRPGGGK